MTFNTRSLQTKNSLPGTYTFGIFPYPIQKFNETSADYLGRVETYLQTTLNYLANLISNFNRPLFCKEMVRMGLFFSHMHILAALKSDAIALDIFNNVPIASVFERNNPQKPQLPIYAYLIKIFSTLLNPIVLNPLNPNESLEKNTTQKEYLFPAHERLTLYFDALAANPRFEALEG